MKCKFNNIPKIKGYGVYEDKKRKNLKFRPYWNELISPTGKYKKHNSSKRYGTLEEANKVLQEIIDTKQEIFELPKDYNKSLNVYSIDFAKSLDKKRRDTTIQNKIGILDKYVLKDYGYWTADEFIHSYKEYEKLYNNIINSGLSSVYINKVLRVIRDFISHLENIGVIKTQQAVRFRYKFGSIANDKRKSKSDEKDFCSSEELKRWIDKIGNDEKNMWYVFFLFQHCNSLRLGEIIGLQRKHLINNCSSVIVEQQVQWVKKYHKSVITPPKTANGNRTLKNPDFLTLIMREYVKVNNINDPEQFLFGGGNKPLGASSVIRAFDYYSKKYDMPYRVQNHMFRRAITTHFFSIPNLSIRQISAFGARMGHDNSTIATLIKNYLNKSKVDDAEIMNLIQQ